MKPLRLTCSALGIAILTCMSSAQAAFPKPTPGTIDPSLFSGLSSSGNRTLELNLTQPLLHQTAQGSAENEPELARILAGIQSVRVHVVGIDPTNRTKVEDSLGKVRATLQADGWDQVAKAREGNADIAVHFRTRGTEAVEGVVVSVLTDDKEATLVNIVGNIRPADLARVGARLRIDSLLKAGEVIQGNDSVKTREK